LQIRWRFGSFLQGWRVFCKKAEDANARALEKLRVARARAHAAQSRAEKLEDSLSRSQADAKALEERTRALQKVGYRLWEALGNCLQGLFVKAVTTCKGRARLDGCSKEGLDFKVFYRPKM
jgi:DNA repair exonuclease SbcCD ATPase subunit